MNTLTPTFSFLPPVAFTVSSQKIPFHVLVFPFVLLSSTDGRCGDTFETVPWRPVDLPFGILT